MVSIHTDEFENHLADLIRCSKVTQEVLGQQLPRSANSISFIRDEVKYKIKNEVRKQQAVIQMIHLEEVNVPEDVRQQNTEGLISLMERRRKKEQEEDEIAPKKRI